MVFPVLALQKLPPPAQKLHPFHAPLSPAQTHLPTHLPPPAHAVPSPAPSRRPPGSQVRTCSGRISWVAANNARVPPPPFRRRVTGNCLSGVGCRVPYGSLTHGDLACGEVADAEGSSRVVRVDVEHDALGSAWRELVLWFCLLWLSPSIAMPLAAFAAPCISARRRALISRKPGRRERKTSVLRPKRGRMVAAAWKTRIGASNAKVSHFVESSLWRPSFGK